MGWEWRYNERKGEGKEEHDTTIHICMVDFLKSVTAAQYTTYIGNNVSIHILRAISKP